MAAMTVAVRVRVPVQEDDRATLGMWSRSTAIRAGFVTRARIVLAAADGEGTTAIARRCLGGDHPDPGVRLQVGGCARGCHGHSGAWFHTPFLSGERSERDRCD